MVIAACVFLIAAIFFEDLWIKNRIEAEAEENFPKELVGGKLLLRRYHNIGAMLNLGAARTAAVRAVSVVLTILVTGVFLLSLGQRGNNTLRLGLALLLGGSFSNTYDRLKRKYVVDYLSFGVRWKWFRAIVFNLSDFCIIIGALLTALGMAHS